MPICEETSIYIRKEFNHCIGYDNLSFDFSTDGVYIHRKRISELQFDREYLVNNNSWGVDVFYNYTSNLYYTPRSYEYYDSGYKNVNISCINSNSNYNITYNESIFIANLPPIFIFTGVWTGDIFQTATVYNETFQYYNGIWQFIGGISDNNIDTVNISFFYPNGSLLVYSNTTTNLNVSSDKFVAFDSLNQNNISVRVFANDTYGLNVTFFSVFTVIDNVTPVCSGYSSSYSIESGTEVDFNITCIDEALYSINLTCGNTTIHYDTYDPFNDLTDIFNLNFSMTENLTCNISVYDGHLTPYNFFSDTFSFILDVVEEVVTSDITVSISENLEDLFILVLIIFLYICSIVFIAWRKDIVSVLINIAVGVILIIKCLSYGLGLTLIVGLLCLYFGYLGLMYSLKDNQKE